MRISGAEKCCLDRRCRRSQRLALVDAQGLVNLITAVAYQFILNLPGAFTQPGTHLLALVRVRMRRPGRKEERKEGEEVRGIGNRRLEPRAPSSSGVIQGGPRS